EEQEITLSNGQQFTFKYELPNRIPIKLRMTATMSENAMMLIPSDVEIRQTIFDNIAERYRLGYNVEPPRYFNLQDAPWASDVTLEYSLDDEDNWSSAVFDAEYVDILAFNLEDIDVVIS